MCVLALEPDRNQAEAIRHACGLAGTTVLVVESADDLLHALHAQSPSLVLLPPLVPAGDETALVEFLRTTPHYDHVEVLLTPLLAPPSAARENRGWLRRPSRRNLGQAALGADTETFAEQLRWSLGRVEQRRTVTREDHEIETLASLSDIVAATPQDLQELQLQDATTRLLRKLEDDRRVHRRFAVDELHGLRDARITFGPRVALIDLSAGGALLESESRLQPDSEATLELARGGDKIVVPFRVLRSHVTALGGSPRYRGACAFKSLLNVADLLEDAALIPAAAMAMMPPPGLQVCNAW